MPLPLSPLRRCMCPYSHGMTVANFVNFVP